MRRWFARHYIVRSTAVGVVFSQMAYVIGAVTHADQKIIFVTVFLGLVGGGWMVSLIRDGEKAREEAQRDGQ